MTTADAIKTLECELMTEAVKVAMNHDYGIKCPTNLCRLASDLFALQVVNDNADCTTDISRIIDHFGVVPTPTDVNTTQECDLTITDITEQGNCPAVVITQV